MAATKLAKIVVKRANIKYLSAFVCSSLQKINFVYCKNSKNKINKFATLVIVCGKR